MVLYAEYREVGDRIVASTACERCGAIIGDLSTDEVAALSTGRYGKVLCFDCEDNSCCICQKELTVREWREELVCGDGDGVVCWFCFHQKYDDTKKGQNESL